MKSQDPTRVYISPRNRALVKLRILHDQTTKLAQWQPEPIPAHIPGQLSLFDADAGRA